MDRIAAKEINLKQPSEQYPLEMDFALRLGDATISLVAELKVHRAVYPHAPHGGGDKNITTGTPVANGTSVLVEVSAGEHGEDYYFEFVVIDSLGRTLEADGWLLIRDFDVR